MFRCLPRGDELPAALPAAARPQVAVRAVALAAALRAAHLSNTQRGNATGERGRRTKPGFLEPCRAEKNKGSNNQGGS